jgi:hypothetical protein
LHGREAIQEFYGDDPKESPDYGRVINKRNFDRLAAFMGSGTVADGAKMTLPTGSSKRQTRVMRASTTVPSTR